MPFISWALELGIRLDMQINKPSYNGNSETIRVRPEKIQGYWKRWP